jgi:hypothetical protein
MLHVVLPQNMMVRGDLSLSCVAHSGCVASHEIIEEYYSGATRDEFLRVFELARRCANERLVRDHGMVDLTVNHGIAAALLFSKAASAEWKQQASTWGRGTQEPQSRDAVRLIRLADYSEGAFDRALSDDSGQLRILV